MSLTSVSCKGLEHIIHSHLMRFFEDKKILCDAQHDLRKRRSCERQLVLTIQDLAMGLNCRSQTDAILLDFSKAFDKVPHQRLPLKLHHYSVRGNILEWVKSFFDGRTQQVVPDGTASSVYRACMNILAGKIFTLANSMARWSLCTE